MFIIRFYYYELSRSQTSRGSLSTLERNCRERLSKEISYWVKWWVATIVIRTKLFNERVEDSQRKSHEKLSIN